MRTHPTQSSRNSNKVTLWDRGEVNVFWAWSPEQIPNGRPLIDQTFNIEAISRAGHWVFETFVVANHKGAVSTKV
jgi:hypothetical protein